MTLYITSSRCCTLSLCECIYVNPSSQGQSQHRQHFPQHHPNVNNVDSTSSLNKTFHKTNLPFQQVHSQILATNRALQPTRQNQFIITGSTNESFSGQVSHTNETKDWISNEGFPTSLPPPQKKKNWDEFHPCGQLHSFAIPGFDWFTR